VVEGQGAGFVVGENGKRSNMLPMRDDDEMGDSLEGVQIIDCRQEVCIPIE
jgi:hypothetical protein